MRRTNGMTATQRLAIGRLDALHIDRVMTWLGSIDRAEIQANEENARAVLRATCPRTEGA